MKKLASMLTVTITGLALLAIPTNTLADHINGHDNCDPVFPVPFPGQEFFNGGILFVTAIGPVDGYIITNTTFDITWVSDGATPASDLQIHGSVQVNETYAYFTVTGADLGFGSGPGVFKGSFSTDELNGLVWPSFFFPPYSIVDLEIDAVNGGGIQGSGYFVDSFINFDVIPAPPCITPCSVDLDGNVGPCEFDAFRGFYDSGDLDSLVESDDSDLCYEPGIVLDPTEAPITLDFTATLPDDSPSTLDVTIESSANTVGLELTVSFWNYNTDSWDVVGTDTQSLNKDGVRTFSGDPVDHVEPGTGEVRTRYEVRVVSFIFLFPWLDCVDRIYWTVG